MSIQGEVVQVAIDQVKGFLYPTDAERAAAFELLVELSTRTTTAQLASTEGSLREALDSIHAMFEITRQVLRSHGVDSAKGSSGNLSLAVIAVRVLNEVFRPTLSKWHPLLTDHEQRRRFQARRATPIEWERTWTRHAQCRSELNELRASVRAYIDTLSRIAGAPAIGDAVLAPPTSKMMRREVLTASCRPSRADASDLAPRAEMVRWLHPVEMFKTWRSAYRVPKSVGGKQSPKKDTAHTPSAVSTPTVTFPATKDTDFWFDYVADMGDGFDGTAPVAWVMGRRQIELPDDRSGELPTPPASMPRGHLVVFGGDEVYPFAADGRYESQTELPFEMGLEADAQLVTEETSADTEVASGQEAGHDITGTDDQPIESPVLVAIPGNHDWLGGIGHFRKMFTKQRPFAGHWATPQTELYWHVELPQGWWLWGIDTGLENEWPEEQINYFTQAAEQLRAGDRVILCTPVPLWQLRQKFPKAYIELRSSLDRLIGQSDATMPLCLSGDSHFFAHFERVDADFGEDHITAGGGGAFLQPTHNLPERIPLERANAEFKLTSRWPRPADSRALAPGARRLIERQYWPLMALAGGLQLAFIALAAIAWGALPWSPDCSCDGWRDALAGVLGSPFALVLLIAVTYSGVIALRGNSVEPKLQKAAQGYGLLIGGAVSASMVLVATVRRAVDPSAWWFGIVASVVVGGVLSIAVFLGLIRWANGRIKAADTLAFSPAYSTRFKHFLRFRIGCDGDLTCYVVGLDPVGVGWYEAMTKKLIVPPHDPAGIPRVHYVWGKTYRKFVPRPIDIALSVSDPPIDIFNPYALSAANLGQLFADLSRELIEGGHTVMYGGTPMEGYTEQLDKIDRRLHANNPNAGRHLINYVSDYQQPAESEFEQDADSHGAKMKMIVVRRTHDTDESDVARRIRDDTVMRHRMTAEAHLRIVIGGDTEPGEQHSRIAPGIVEEAYQAIEAGLPLLVAGGSGGAAGLIADALLHRSDHAELDRLANRLIAPGAESDAAPDVGFIEMMRSFNSLGQLGNGLTDGENRELLTTTDSETIIRLVMRSVSRIAEQHEH